MKKGTWIAIGVLVALVAVFFVVRDEPTTTVATPLTIEPVEALSRVEVVPPESKEGADLVVFARDDGQWRLTKPYDSALTKQAREQLDAIFGEAIGTDDLTVPAGEAAAHGLGDDAAYRVSLYGADADSPAVELLVGEAFTVEATGAERTYVTTPGGESIYRAQTDLGSFVRRDVSSLRDRQILDFEAGAATEVVVEYADGQRLRVKRDEAGTGWKIVEPEVDYAADPGLMRELVGALARLRASDFADDAKPSDVGLAPPKAVVTVELDDGSRTVHLGWTGEVPSAYYVRPKDGEQIYEIGTFAGDKLTPTAESLRTRVPNPVAMDAVTGAVLPAEGGGQIVVRKADGDWKVVEPADQPVDATQIGRRIRTLAQLRVDDYADEGVTVSGRPAHQVVLEAGDERHVLQVFGPVDGDETKRYARFEDQPDVFIVRQSTVDQLTPALSDLAPAQAAKAPAGMPQPPGSPRN